ncbi:hypothetical protein OUZ56_014594 [Daphnia magna]|uniref:Uncharacterized protein n=1 Tax=Daphnia magna TaxID=35525 RepID=A0ABR0AK89_9CRUS|nr:hypothetical protein OUZ56_014594 [Daphnia magna]
MSQDTTFPPFTQNVPPPPSDVTQEVVGPLDVAHDATRNAVDVRCDGARTNKNVDCEMSGKKIARGRVDGYKIRTTSAGSPQYLSRVPVCEIVLSRACRHK